MLYVAPVDWNLTVKMPSVTVLKARSLVRPHTTRGNEELNSQPFRLPGVERMDGSNRAIVR